MPYETDEDSAGIRTHSRYARNLSVLVKSNAPSFNIPSSVYRDFSDVETQKIIKKLNIVQYTVDSIKKEFEYSKIDEEFLPLSLSWLWIKGYYSIFHLLSLLVAQEKTDARYLFDKKYNGHSKILVLSNEILCQHKPFNISHLNSVFLGSDLEKFTTSDSENLRNVEVFGENLYKLSIKKVMKDEKKKDGIKTVRTRQYSVFNLCLHYRERFNYSGFHYLESELEKNQDEIKKFYNASYEVILSIVNALATYLASKTRGDLNEKLQEIKHLAQGE